MVASVQAPRVAYQGVPGAYGEAAARTRAGDAITIPARTFADAIALVRDRLADEAVLPVWNSTIGGIADARRALRECESDVEAVDELLVPVRHCLLALPGATLETLRAVASHPAALAQCSRFLAEHPGLTACVAFDTAGAARDLSRLAAGDELAGAGRAEAPWYVRVWRAGEAVDPRALAVIASRAAADRYGLAVLDENIQDDPDNATLFVVVRARAEAARW
jgi:prephenate dehydratase